MLEDTREDPLMDQSDYAIFITPDSAFGFDGEELGDWVDMMLPIKEIYAAIQQITDRSSTGGIGDYTITDNNGFGGIQIDDLSIENIQRLAGLIEEYGEDIIESLVEYYGLDDLQSVARTANSNDGIYEDMADFAEETATSIWDIPDTVSNYIDYERFGKDLEQDYNAIPHGSKIIVVRA